VAGHARHHVNGATATRTAIDPVLERLQVAVTITHRPGLTHVTSLRGILGARAIRPCLCQDCVSEEAEVTVAEATVFVDDAVLGRLPSVCVKDGTYTADRMTLRELPKGARGTGVLWLLIFVGPVGWLVLLALTSMRQSGGVLTVTLPFSEGAYGRLVRSRRERWPWGIMTVVVGMTTFVYLASSGNEGSLRVLLGVVGVIVAVITLIGWMASVNRFRTAAVGLQLDASRRWVTLSGVHSDFASAVQQQLDYHDVG
jgi:hypothetical protein